MKKLFIVLMTIGVVGEYLDEVHGIGWYLDTGNQARDLTIGWVLGFGGIVMCVFLILNFFGVWDRKEEETYYQDEEYQEDAEIYETPVKIT